MVTSTEYSNEMWDEWAEAWNNVVDAPDSYDIQSQDEWAEAWNNIDIG